MLLTSPLDKLDVTSIFPKISYYSFISHVHTQTDKYAGILVLHISLSRSHKSRLRTISGNVLCGGAGRGCPGVKGRREGGGRGGARTSLNTTAAALDSDPAGLSCYLASEYTPRPVAQRQPKLCPALLSLRV